MGDAQKIIHALSVKRNDAQQPQDSEPVNLRDVCHRSLSESLK
jgi:hypothetical protein